MNDLTQHFQSIDWNNSEKVNSVFKLLFSHYHKDKNFPYESLLNKVEGYLPNKYKNQFLYRKDGRTLGQFGVDIYSGHLLERNIADWWFSNFGNKHFGDKFEYECVGIDDSGTLLLEDKGRNEMKRPDYLIKPNTYVEIKSNICDWKLTPKVSDLKHYISLNSYVLIVCSDGKFRENGKNCSCYMLLDYNQCKEMIKKSIVLNDRFECGNKPCIQFYWDLSQEERKTKIMMNKLSSKALNIKDFCGVQYV